MIDRDGLGQIEKLEAEVRDLARDRDGLRSLLAEAYECVGYASCKGDRCRLPHCHDCNDEPKDLVDLDGRISEALKDDS